MVFSSINVWCFIVEPIPRWLHSPNSTFPPVVTPGPVLEKFLKVLLWSIDEDVLIKQCSPILVPLFIIEPDIIIEPFPILTSPFIVLFFEIIVSQLKFLQILLKNLIPHQLYQTYFYQ